MKRLFLLLALCGIVAVGCTEGGVDDNIDNGGNNTEQPDNGGNNTEQPDNGGNEDESDIPENIFFGLDKESATLSPDGGSVDVVVYSNYKWEISGTSDWCTPSITKGDANEDGQKVTFSADVAYDDREATFWFRCADEKIKVVVSQKFKETIIAVENNTFNLKGLAQSINIAYQTTVECEVVIPEEAKSWISLAPATRALVNESATLNIAENNTGTERSVVVKVVAANNKELVAEYTITQNQRYFMEYTSEDGYTVFPYDSSAFDATIIRNEYIDGKGYIDFDAQITSIGDDAFYDCNSLTSVTIPDSVTSIGDYAFYNCTSLTSITIGKGVTEIGKNAFSGCTGELIVNCNIPSASSYDYGAFYDSMFTQVTIGNGVTSIGSYAFYDCDSLISVTIGNGVTSIDYNAFYSCTSLTSVYITDIAAWCNISFGNHASNPLTWAGNLYLNNELVTDLIIPDGATKIGSYAFYRYDLLTSITIPDSVTSIGESAFCNCTSLTSITIPDSVTSIGSYAFSYCDSLTSVTIGNGVTSIGWSAFEYCDSLISVTIGNGVTSIDNNAFYDCTSLTSVYITDIAAWCNISFDDYDSNPLSYAGNLYLNNELVTDLIIPNGATKIGSNAFYGYDLLTSITIPDSVTSIGRSAFCDCDSLTSVTIPDSVTSIGESVFEYCDSLASVTIGNGVTSVGGATFCYCTSLKEVYCKPTTPPTGGFNMFYNNASGRKIYVPSNSVSAYKSASGWSGYSSYIVGYNF